MSDAVNNPAHYNQGSIECIDAMQIVLTPEEYRGFLKGNAIKYLWREENKNGIEDLRKAKWYLDRLVKSFETHVRQKEADLQSLKDYPFGELKQPAWTPKVGDWVRINAPEPGDPMHTKNLEDLDGKILQVVGSSEFDKRYAAFESDHGSFYVLIDLLEPAEQPVIKQFLTPKPDPGEGYRLLSKNPPEKLLDTDEGLFACGLDGQQWLSVNYSSGEQLPSVYYRRKIDVETLKQSPQLPDGWRWLNEDEVIRKGDSYWYGARWYDFDCSIGEQLATDMWPSIRRNRFNVGEKVVHVNEIEPCEVVGFDREKDKYWITSNGNKYAYGSKWLAPYIEETT